ALRASEDRWRRFFESSSAGIALNAPGGRYITAELALQKNLCFKEEEMQSLKVFKENHQEDLPPTEGGLAGKAGGEGSVHRFEKRFIRKDGGVIWADVSTVFVPTTGNTPGFFANVVVDITERKRAEASLAQLNRTLKTLYQCNKALVHATEEYELLQS